MLIIKDGGRPASVKALALAIRETGIVPKNRWYWLEANITNLRDGPDMVGEVDIQNEQQVALVAFRVKTRVPRRLRYVKVRTDEYALVVVGAGSTAAYYLDTLGPAHDKSGTLVIGKENPWIDERGHGISYINHTRRQVALPSQNVTDYGGNDTFVQRKKFGVDMSKRVASLAGRVVDDLVTNIKWTTRNEKSMLELTCKGGNGPFYAERVVFVAGSGASRKPKVDATKYANCVIEMNTFIRDVAEQEKPRKGQRKRVVVWGSNAAIDAVAAAKKHGWEVVSWLYSQGGGPAWLPGTRYRSAPYNLHELPTHEYADRNAIKIVDGATNTVNVKDGEKVFAANVRYVIYGLGSNDLLAEVMDKKDLVGERAMLPLLDEAGVFCRPGDSTPQDKAFLGWGTKDGSLKVFGLAAENYEDEKRSRINSLADRRVLALKKWLSGDVLTVGQLTYIRSAMRAVNNYVPGSIEHRVDFSHADANQLRIHLAAKYPDIPEPFARWFIDTMSDLRSNRKLQDRLPHGFTTKQVKLIEDKLAALERYGRGFTSGFETLPKLLEAITPALGSEVKQALRKIPPKQR